MKMAKDKKEDKKSKKAKDKKSKHKRDKKEAKDKKEKKSKHKNEKEKRHDQKLKSSSSATTSAVKVDGNQFISEDDYFLKNEEFRVWCKLIKQRSVLPNFPNYSDLFDSG